MGLRLRLPKDPKWRALLGIQAAVTLLAIGVRVQVMSSSDGAAKRKAGPLERKAEG